MHRRVTVVIESGASQTCFSPPELALHVGDGCVFEADGVLDFGRVHRVVEVEGDTSPEYAKSRVLRCATLQDQSKAEENAIMSKMAHDTCARKMQQTKLDIRVASVRYSFDRAALVVTYSSEEQVNCNELIKEMSAETGARIIMKQIGVRDATSMIGGMGICGRRLCCCSWLKRFDSINVKMAKTQSLSLNPEIISGMCGRLKCCLKYEHENYRDLARHVPKEGSRVHCPEGIGTVAERSVLAQKVRIRLEDNRLVEHTVDMVSKAGGNEAEAHVSGRKAGSVRNGRKE